MRGLETIIGLSPSAVEVAQFHSGECVAYDRMPTAPADWATSWSKQFRNLDEALLQSVRKLGISPRQAVDIVYCGPDTFVEVLGLKASGDDALSAARLALAEGMPGDVDERPHHLRILSVDQSGADRFTHVLAVTERDEAAQAVVSWVQRAGLTVRSLVPTGALAMSAAVEQVLAASSEGTVSLLHVSEHRMVIAAASAGSLLCVRNVAFGFDAIADAVLRAAATMPEGETPVVADYEKAVDAVLSIGIPRRDQEMGFSGLKGESVLPYLQPALQRCVVEIKQTLRFALGESELARSRMVLSGPGSTIPQFIQLLTSQIEIPVSLDATTPQRLVSPASDLPLAASADRAAYKFLPRLEMVKREGVVRRRCLIAGAGVAGLVLAGDALLAMKETRTVNQAISEVAPRLQAVREDAELRARAASLGTRVNSEEQAVREALGERPDWGALFGEIARLSAHPIRLLEISVTHTVNGYAAALRGVSYLEKNEQGEETDSLAQYIATLQGSPLIRGVELGSTHSGKVEGRPVKHFLVTARLTGLPVSLSDWEARP